MVKIEDIVLNEPIYYVPQYGSGVAKVSILKMFDDGNVLVKQYRKNGDDRDCKPFCRPISFVYACAKDAQKGCRSWESHERRMKKQKKELKRHKND